VALGHVVVRSPTTADVPDLLELWEELRSQNSRSLQLAPPATEDRLHELLAKVAEDPALGAVVAEVDGAVVGVACFVVRQSSPFVETTVAQIDYLHVRNGFHRRGVGRALVAAAAGFAETMGAEHVSVSIFPHLREANRFYAKLGFSPLVVSRVAPISMLRRKLGLEGADQRQLSGLLARRRSALRARASSHA
jgi:ribosomal protein S18 acetylase RimI-like enzyme